MRTRLCLALLLLVLSCGLTAHGADAAVKCCVWQMVEEFPDR